MRAKTYLRQLERINIAINQKIAERMEMYSRASGRGVSLEGVHVQSGGPQDSTGSLALKLAALAEEIDAEIDRYVALKHKIINQIQELDSPLHMAILYKRYVEGKRLEQIAVEMNYSYGRIKHLHGSALLEFSDKHFKVDTQ
jgi:hypothetical protein